MTNQKTGLMLSEVRGPLTNLIDNLLGENSDYWLNAVKKMLRKETLPDPPPEVLMQLMESNPHREKMREKIQIIAEHIRKIPVVSEVYVIKEGDDEDDLLNISVYAGTSNFLHNMKKQDTFGFYLKTDGSVTKGDLTDMREIDIDSVFKKWYEDFKIEKTSDLKQICTALTALGELYEKSVLQIEI